MMRKFLIIVLVLLLLAAGGLLFAAQRLTADQVVADDTRLTIDEGSSTAAIAGQLEAAGLVADSRVFRLFARQQQVDSSFQAGDYTFNAGSWSLQEVCQALIAGGVSQGDAVRVTIPEGKTVVDTLAILEAAGLGSAADYLTYIEAADFSDYPFIPAAADVIAPANRLEGFLFPDTYLIDPSWDQAQIIDLLLSQFVRVWDSNGMSAQAEELGYSLYQVVTMAALVEKEAKTDGDRPLIAGVFYKRLDIGMYLQEDSTIQFLLGEPKSPLLYSDLEIESPYNTYKNPGLPPGPIAAPGLKALQAALNPEITDYLYFRARTDGSHRFSTSLSEHETPHEGDQ